MAKRDPYPLQWPDGWKRSTSRGVPRFTGAFARDRDSVIHQLKMRRGSHIVVTSDLPTRNDGLPYANATCQDPGIAVYWIERGKEQVIACDRWRTVGQNMRAIDLSIEALRGLDRWGATEMVERAFAGFAALPPGSNSSAPPQPARRSWREVFQVNGLEQHVGPAELFVIVKTRYRDAIKKAHPDAGGDHAIAAELNAALAEAECELGATP